MSLELFCVYSVYADDCIRFTCIRNSFLTFLELAFKSISLDVELHSFLLHLGFYKVSGSSQMGV